MNLREGKYEGFVEFPYFVFPWAAETGEQWGWSPALEAMPDIKTIDRAIEIKYEALPLMVNPPQKTTPNNIQAIKSKSGNIEPGAQVVCKDIEKLHSRCCRAGIRP